MASSTKNNRLLAYVKYDSTNRIIPMVLVKRTHVPEGKGWVQVPETLCCSLVPFPVPNNGDEKAYIKYDKKGDVVSSSTIVRVGRKSGPPKDKSGIWKEIPFDRCCNTTTTTTTTSSTTTSTTTLP